MAESSRYLALYPPHRCQECSMEHIYIPHIVAPQKGPDGKPVMVALAPFEVLGVIDGRARPGKRWPGMDTPAYVYGLLWGTPGSRDITTNSVLYMN